MPKPVFLDNDYLSLQISFIKQKYINKEKSPIIIVRNKEIDL